MYKISLIILLTTISACVNSDRKNSQNILSSTQEVKQSQFLDLWVYEDAIYKVNGQEISESALVNQIQELSINKGDRARILIGENAWFGSVAKLQSLLVKEGLGLDSINIKVLESEEMDKVGKEILLIDVQQGENITFNGKQIHLQDLRIALNSYNQENLNVWLSVSDLAIVGTVFDAKKQILDNGFNITFL